MQFDVAGKAIWSEARVTDQLNTLRIAVPFVGGMHQALHIAPVAIALAQKGHLITAFVPVASDKVELEKLLAALDSPNITIIQMQAPGLLERLLIWRWFKIPAKVARLLFWSRQIRSFDAILAAERTSTVLKQLPGQTPPMIHIPHGAGDRAKGFEPRHALYDHVIAAGPKVRRRLIAQGAVKPEACTVAGAIKVVACRHLHRSNPPDLFGNDRPIVLYNPHFDHSLSSWGRFADPLITAIVEDGRFNLIVAPHVRMFQMATESQRDEWRARAIAGCVVVDLDSPLLNDMTYTNVADIYLGDVSSQVYEFSTQPRPCIFINAHGVTWQNNQDYANWQFGEVCDDISGIIDAIATASQTHRNYIEVQKAMVADMLGDTSDRAPSVAAEQFMAALKRISQTV
jgi:hypothetical protein